MFSLANAAVYLVGIATMLGALIALLPSSAEYPFPPEIQDFLYTAVEYMYSLNTILPIQEFFNIIQYALVIMFLTRLVWPSAMWIFRVLTKAAGS